MCEGDLGDWRDSSRAVDDKSVCESQTKIYRHPRRSEAEIRDPSATVIPSPACRQAGHPLQRILRQVQNFDQVHK